MITCGPLRPSSWRSSRRATPTRSPDPERATVTFEILDSLLRRHTVTVEMNGTTPVLVPLPVASAPEALPSTTNTAFRVERPVVSLVGTQYGANDGNIEIRKAGGGTPLGYIGAGHGRARRACLSTAIDEEMWIPQGVSYVSGRRDARLANHLPARQSAQRYARLRAQADAYRHLWSGGARAHRQRYHVALRAPWLRC